MFAAATPAPFGEGAPMVTGHPEGWGAWGQFWHCVNNKVNIRMTLLDFLGVRAFAKCEHIAVGVPSTGDTVTVMTVITTMDFTINGSRMTCEYLLHDEKLRLLRTKRG